MTSSVEPAQAAPLALHPSSSGRWSWPRGALALGVATAAAFVAIAESLAVGWFRIGAGAFALSLASCAALVVGEEGARRPHSRASLGALALEVAADPALRPRCLRLAPVVAGPQDESRARAFVLEAMDSPDPAARDAGLAAGWGLALPEARAAVYEELTSLVRSRQGAPPADRRDLRWRRATLLCTADAEHQAIREVLRALDPALGATSRRAP